MRLLITDFLYSAIVYYINNLYNCYQILALSGNATVVINYQITQITRQENIIYLIGTSPCNATLNITSISLSVVKCTSCSDGSRSGLVNNSFVILNPNVNVLSTTFYIRITLPQDIIQ